MQVKASKVRASMAKIYESLFNQEEAWWVLHSEENPRNKRSHLSDLC